MGIINEGDKEELKRIFKENLKDPVTLVVFTDDNCRFCKETKQICDELAELSDLVSVEHHTMDKKDMAEKYGVTMAPAISIIGKDDYGVRYYGIPAGYEFTSLVEDIIDVSRGETDLSDETKKALRELSGDVHMMVFVTPSCPYCPMAVRTAHKMAIESSKVKADMVEATEFPELSDRYQVMAVPKIVINEGKVMFEGAYPEKVFLKKVLAAV